MLLLCADLISCVVQTVSTDACHVDSLSQRDGLHEVGALLTEHGLELGYVTGVDVLLAP